MFGGNGSTVYSGLNWWEAAEVLASHGKRPPSIAEYAAAAYGTTENQSRGSDPVTTGLSTTNGGSSNGDEKFTSKWGVVQATGCVTIWTNDFGGPHGSASWTAVTGGRGQVHQITNVGRASSSWTAGVSAGSRSLLWSYDPSQSHSTVGARGVAEHVCQI